MFVQHKQLKSLNVPADKVSHLHYASSSVQLAFAGYPPQQCKAYLLQIRGGDKVLVVVAFYLASSGCSIFFVPKFGELPVEDAEAVYEEGFNFVESMGFVLTETDYHLLSAEKKKQYWEQLPICKSAASGSKSQVAVAENDEVLEKYRQVSINSLGRLFASL